MSRMSAPDNSEHSSLSVGDENGPHNDRDEDNMTDDFYYIPHDLSMPKLKTRTPTRNEWAWLC